MLALALFLVPSAVASDTTNAIIRDVAADGHVDGNYTAGQLRAALKSPLLAQYGGSGGVAGVQSALGKKSKPGSSKPGSSKPASKGTSPSVAAAPGTGKSSGNLPFTGSDLALFLVIGGVLIAAGIALRRLGRHDGTQS